LRREESQWKVARRTIVLDASAHLDKVSACSFKRSLNSTAMAGHAPQLPLAFDREEPLAGLRVAGEALAVSQSFFTM
jgi:hypothetical protein